MCQTVGTDNNFTETKIDEPGSRSKDSVFTNLMHDIDAAVRDLHAHKDPNIKSESIVV